MINEVAADINAIMAHILTPVLAATATFNIRKRNEPPKVPTNTEIRFQLICAATCANY